MRAAVALAAPLALVVACVSLEPRPDRSRYFVLEPQPGPTSPGRPAIPVLGVGPVRLPPYLDRPEIVTRAGAAQVEVASDDRWAAPLEELFTSALSEDLRAAVPALEVLRWPWPVAATPEWSVSVDVLRFEGEAGGGAVLEARWTLRRAGAPARQGVTSAREGGAARDVGSTVPALSRTVGALARDIAAAVDESRGERRAILP